MAAALLGNIAAYLVALGCYDLAQAHSCEALRLAREVDEEVSVVLAIQHLAAVAALRPHDDSLQGADDRARAARLTGFVDGRIAALEVMREYTEQHEYEVTLEALRAALSSDAIMAFMNDGRTWTLDQAVEVALRV